MKKVIIKRMSLLNFKGQRDLTVDFSPGVTNILGANGTGKTTIFDAFTWLLFGKDSHNRESFDIKTLDKDGVAIPRLPHEVTAVLSIDGEEVTLTRRFNEIWRKKRGAATERFEGHETERLYNDVPCSVDEWKEKIAAICTEEDFKYITNPAYFTSLKADKQRKKLCEMAGDVDSNLLSLNPEFGKLREMLASKTIEELKREISAKKTRLNSVLKDLPPRIDERKRKMPEAEDWAAIESELSEKQAALHEAEAALIDWSKRTDAQNNEQLALSKKIGELKLALQRREYEIYREATKSYYEQKDSADRREADINRLTASISHSKAEVATLARQLEQLDSQRTLLIGEWQRLKSQTLTFNPGDFNCPTCGHPYDTTEVAKRQGEMLAAFNKRQSELIAENIRKGTEVKKQRESLVKQTEAANARIGGLVAELDEKQRQEIAIGEKPSEAEIISQYTADKEYCTIKAEIHTAEQDLEAKKSAQTVSDNSQLLEAVTVLRGNIDNLKGILSNKALIEQNEQRIAELEAEMRVNAQELADLECLEYTIQQFSKQRMEAVSTRINSMFRFVRFKMFEQQINGGEKETCEVTVDGVPYSSLNTASQVNAGLDIINAISRHIGITVPIFIENAEGVLELEPTQAQTIRLVVADVPRLTVSQKSTRSNLFDY